MSLHQKQYREPEPLELDVTRLRRYVRVLRESLTVLVEKGEGCITGKDNCEPGCCKYGHARKVLRDTENIYFPPGELTPDAPVVIPPITGVKPPLRRKLDRGK